MPRLKTRSVPVRHVLAAALALAAAPAMAQGPFSRTVFFGDSLTDAGYFRPLLVQMDPNAAVLGRFTTNPGLVWAEHLARYYGTDASPNGNGQNGDNYAAGGAMIATDRIGPPFGLTPSLQTQMTNYLAANGGRADPDALYTVWGGANDLFSISSNPGQAQQIIGAAVAGQVGIVGALKSAGARYVLVPNIPDIGLTPSFASQGPLAAAQGTAVSVGYNDALYGALAANGLSVIPVDTFTFLREVVANPGLYGFSNVTGTACEPQITAQSITCHPGTYAAPGADRSYLFADGVHPSSATHEIIADLAIAMIEGPRQIAALPLSAAGTGKARADRVADGLSRRPGQDGRRWWMDLRGDFQRYGHGDEYDGMGPALAVGLDWARGNAVFGGFAGYGLLSSDWGHNRGDWKQKEATIGLSAGWFGGNGLWVNGQLSYTRLDFTVDRKVPLGPAVRAHRGTTDGSNLSVALHAGWNLGGGALRHGPVLSVVAQRIDVDGFAESDPGMSTSLAYADQSHDSLIGSLGWQASYVVAAGFEPYARLTVDREFEEPAEQAFAQAQSLPSTLEYAVPGLYRDRTWGTLTVGARTRLFGLDANIGASMDGGRRGGRHSGVFVTLGGGF